MDKTTVRLLLTLPVAFAYLAKIDEEFGRPWNTITTTVSLVCLILIVFATIWREAKIHLIAVCVTWLVIGRGFMVFGELTGWPEVTIFFGNYVYAITPWILILGYDDMELSLSMSPAVAKKTTRILAVISQLLALAMILPIIGSGKSPDIWSISWTAALFGLSIKLHKTEFTDEEQDNDH